MEKQTTLSNSEWIIMEQLWMKPHTLMELVAILDQRVGWSKSTVATMVRRMVEKGVIIHTEQGRTKLFSPAVSRVDVTTRETKNLLQRAYHGSLGLLVNTMVQSKDLTKEDIEELYSILKKAAEDAT
jgi:predicted transcriptional regulator